MILTRNPLYLGFIFVAFLLAKAMWVQLDISGEFSNGVVSVHFFWVLFKHFVLFPSKSIGISFARTWVSKLKFENRYELNFMVSINPQ